MKITADELSICVKKQFHFKMEKKDSLNALLEWGFVKRTGGYEYILDYFKEYALIFPISLRISPKAKDKSIITIYYPKYMSPNQYFTWRKFWSVIIDAIEEMPENPDSKTDEVEINVVTKDSHYFGFLCLRAISAFRIQQLRAKMKGIDKMEKEIESRGDKTEKEHQEALDIYKHTCDLTVPVIAALIESYFHELAIVLLKIRNEPYNKVDKEPKFSLNDMMQVEHNKTFQYEFLKIKYISFTRVDVIRKALLNYSKEFRNLKEEKNRLDFDIILKKTGKEDVVRALNHLGEERNSFMHRWALKESYYNYNLQGYFETAVAVLNSTEEEIEEVYEQELSVVHDKSTFK